MFYMLEKIEKFILRAIPIGCMFVGFGLIGFAIGQTKLDTSTKIIEIGLGLTLTYASYQGFKISRML